LKKISNRRLPDINEIKEGDWRTVEEIMAGSCNSFIWECTVGLQENGDLMRNED
jgi:hypothetical protein